MPDSLGLALKLKVMILLKSFVIFLIPFFLQTRVVESVSFDYQIQVQQLT